MKERVDSYYNVCKGLYAEKSVIHIMRKSVKVELQTGLFKRTDFKLKATAAGLTFTPSAKGDDEILIPAASIKEVALYEVKLKMEVQADTLTEVYFANSENLLDTLKALKENIGAKVVCEFN